AFHISRGYVKTRQRHAVLRSLIAATGLNKDFAKLLSQTDVPRRAVNRAFEGLDRAIHHPVLHQQVGVDDRALGIGFIWIRSYHIFPVFVFISASIKRLGQSNIASEDT